MFQSILFPTVESHTEGAKVRSGDFNTPTVCVTTVSRARDLVGALVEL